MCRGVWAGRILKYVRVYVRLCIDSANFGHVASSKNWREGFCMPTVNLISSLKFGATADSIFGSWQPENAPCIFQRFEHPWQWRQHGSPKRQQCSPFQHGVVSYSVHSFVCLISNYVSISGVPRNFVRGGVQQIQLRTEDRDNGDLGAVAP